MLSINQNSASLNFIERLNNQREELAEKLASGKKINKAADDAAGLQIANRLTSEINQSQQLSINAQDQINLNDVQSGALSAINESLQRANVLSIQSGNPLYDSSAIQGELDQITEQVNVIASDALGQDDFLSALDATDPSTTQTILQDASVVISDTASSLGANSNALSSQVSIYETNVVNVSESRSRIEDADFAKLSGEQQQNEILLRSAIITKKNEEEKKGLLFNQLV